jgi:hypothetical protein
VDDAQLDAGVRINRMDGFGKTSKPVHAGDKDVLNATVFQFG